MKASKKLKIAMFFLMVSISIVSFQSTFAAEEDGNCKTNKERWYCNHNDGRGCIEQPTYGWTKCNGAGTECQTGGAYCGIW